MTSVFEEKPFWSSLCMLSLHISNSIFKALIKSSTLNKGYLLNISVPFMTKGKILFAVTDNSDHFWENSLPFFPNKHLQRHFFAESTACIAYSHLSFQAVLFPCLCWHIAAFLGTLLSPNVDGVLCYCRACESQGTCPRYLQNGDSDSKMLPHRITSDQ